MNNVLDSWSSPWRAFHKNLAGAARPSETELDPALGDRSWLKLAHAATRTSRMRPDQATDR
jgi:hypothetical protein